MSLQIILVNCINFGFYLMHIVIGRIGLICIIPLIATQILTYFLQKYYNIQMTMNAFLEKNFEVGKDEDWEYDTDTDKSKNGCESAVSEQNSDLDKLIDSFLYRD